MLFLVLCSYTWYCEEMQLATTFFSPLASFWYQTVTFYVQLKYGILLSKNGRQAHLHITSSIQ